jgi:hypothetical protein
VQTATTENTNGQLLSCLLFISLSSFPCLPDSKCFFLLGSILWCSQSGDHLQEDLVKFGYKLNMKVGEKKSFYTFGYLLEWYTEIWWLFLNFDEFLAIENFKKLLILPLLIFNFDYWCVYIYIYIYKGRKNKVGQVFFFLGSILWCSSSGDHPQEDLTKFGYKIHLIKGKKKHPSIFGVTNPNHVRIWWFLLKQLSNFGKRKYLKTLDFSTFEFQFCFLSRKKWLENLILGVNFIR